MEIRLAARTLTQRKHNMAAEGNASQLVGIVTLLGAAVVAVPLFKRLGLGAVLGYLAAGLAIGPYGLGLVTDAQTILHVAELGVVMFLLDRKSTRLNSSHLVISYAVFCLKKKNN